MLGNWCNGISVHPVKPALGKTESYVLRLPKLWCSVYWEYICGLMKGQGDWASTKPQKTEQEKLWMEEHFSDLEIVFTAIRSSFVWPVKIRTPCKFALLGVEKNCKLSQKFFIKIFYTWKKIISSFPRCERTHPMGFSQSDHPWNRTLKGCQLTWNLIQELRQPK